MLVRVKSAAWVLVMSTVAAVSTGCTGTGKSDGSSLGGQAGYQLGSQASGKAGWFGGEAGEILGRHAGAAAGDKVDPAKITTN